MTKHCWDCWILWTRLKSCWSIPSTFSPQASVTALGKFSIALQPSKSSFDFSGSSFLRTSSFRIVFSRWRSVTSFWRLSKKNFLRSLVLLARIRLRSLLRSIWAWVFCLPRPGIVWAIRFPFMIAAGAAVGTGSIACSTRRRLFPGTPSRAGAVCWEIITAGAAAMGAGTVVGTAACSVGKGDAVGAGGNGIPGCKNAGAWAMGA
mmetsp:Transcript_12192/g.28234  ORF Transcript_12192/g.28234 Transcript_12192/m.28234 type:complete len:205 (-) Transcript_12192:450-1064(-)